MVFGRLLMISSTLMLATIVSAFAGASDPTRIQCESKKFAGKSVSWCHEWDVGSATNEVVYYFHGIGGDEKIWQDTPMRQALRDAVAKQKKPMPHVFAVSFGWAWFLSDVKKGKSPSRMDILLKQVMPALEASLKKKPEVRVLLGESMGGYNALSAAMADPKGFAMVVALCPAVLPIGPYASEEEEAKFIERNPQMNVEMVRSLKEWVQQEFPSAADWARNNPLDRADNEAQGLPLALLSDNSGDEYGFTEGTAAFAKKIADRGGKLLLRALPGSHCHHTPELLTEAANFILQR